MIERCPDPQDDCPYYNRKPPKRLKAEGYYIGCTANKHHLFYPRRDYATPLEHAFRELPENKEQTCRWEHDLIHEMDPIPYKPTVHEMIVALTVKIDN